jgi:thioredoxin 1
VGKVAQVGTNEFDAAVLQSSKPVVVDFYAQWCGPCRMIAPVLDDLSEVHKDKLTIVKVDIDDAPEVAEKYAVDKVPTIVIFKAGQESDRKLGALPKPALESWILASTK